MIMAFGILMLGLYDLQVRRVLRYDQSDQDERRCKKMQRENMETLGTPELFYFFGLGSPFLFCRFCKIIFNQDGGIHV